MKQINFYGIIKFGKKEHIEELYKNGVVYMQRSENYTQIEDEERSDKNENLTQLVQANQVKSFKIDEKEVNPIGNIKIRKSNRKNPFIFSSFALTENQFLNGRNIISREMIKFGDTALWVRDFDKFFNLILQNINHDDNLYCNFVKYVNEREYHGDMDVFKKLKQYKHQNEHRIVLESLRNTNNSITISLGSLQEISCIFSSDILLKTLRAE